MFELIKKIFIGLLIGIISASNHTKCISQINQKCMTQPTFIKLCRNEYSLEFHYYLFAFKLDVLEIVMLLMIFLTKYMFQIKQDSNLGMFSMITGINESKTLAKHICECKYRFDGRNCNSDQW